jgi:3-(3-hydroxy-phenyl)propionate hydroxylase
LSRVLFEMARGVPDLEIRTETEVIGCSQRAGAVEVTVRKPDGSQERVVGTYLVGCDGARSVVRDDADIAFEGFTYPERFMSIGRRDMLIAIKFSDPMEWCR